VKKTDKENVREGEGERVNTLPFIAASSIGSPTRFGPAGVADPPKRDKGRERGGE
jgi:hypothetical protein